jgi:MFS family permease
MPDIKTFRSLRNPVFRLYFTGMVGQWVSMNMQIVARSLLIYRISDSGTILGLASLANAIPMIMISLWGGAIADRLQKKSILFFSMAASMFISFGVAASLTTGILSADREGSWWILIVTAAIQGIVMGVMMPSRQAIISEIVEPEQVMNAVSLNMMGMNVFRILGPAVSGFLVDAFGFDVVYYLSGAMYGMAAVCMILMPKTRKAVTLQGESALQDILDGVQYIRQHKTMMLVLVATLFVMVCGMPMMQLLPMVTEDVLHVGASEMGILLSISGIGAILGSLALASMPSRKRGIIMLSGGVIMGTALVFLAVSKWWAVSIAVMVFVGLGQTVHRASGNSLVQNYTEPEYRGRVMSFMMMGIGFSSLGTFFAGLLAESVGIQWSIGSLAMLLVIVSVALLVGTARVRRLE